MKHIVNNKEINIAFAKCCINPRGWEDAVVNGETDEYDEPMIPCVKKINDRYLAWCPIINLDTGQIVNWKEGTTAHTFYKSCDENEIEFIDDKGEIVKKYSGYVPNFMSPDDKSYGDYIYMTIDKDGFIQNFNPNLDDVFKE